MTISLKAGLTTAGAIVALIGSLYTGWNALNEHWALSKEVNEMNRNLQMRDNVNYLEGRKSLTQYDINRISDVLEMYQTRELLNGELDAADRNRVEGLKDDMDAALATMSRVNEAIEAIRLKVSDVPDLR